MDSPPEDIKHQVESQARHEEDVLDAKAIAENENRIRKTVEQERQTTVTEAFRLYPKAVAWCILLSTSVIMEGYDLLLVSSFFAFSPWVQKYGSFSPMFGLYNGAAVGEIIGLFLNGVIAERIGYRKAMMGALGVITILIFIPFFAPSVEVLQVGTILMGIPWGVFQTLPATYASEVCPVALRGYLTTYINICWVSGQLLASGVLKALLQRSDQWAYRIPYALQWMWPVPLIIGVALAAKSPWWYIRHGNREAAKKAVQRLVVQRPGFSIDDTVEVMVYTNEIEKENLCGTALMNNSTYFFLQEGLNESNSFSLSMGQYAIEFAGVFRAWLLMLYSGRRQLYIIGLCVLTLLLLGMGFTCLAPESSTTGQWAAGSLLLVFALCYNLTVGTVTYFLVSEVSSLRLRAKTVSLARNVYNVCSIVSGVITPYMLNPTAWNWKNRAGFFWAGICFLCLTWAFFRVPETKGRTYAELDILFEKEIPARGFATAPADLFDRSDEGSKEQSYPVK